MLLTPLTKFPNPREALRAMKVICLPIPWSIYLLLSIPKAAQELSISRSSMYRLISEGRIPTVNVVGKMRIKETTLKSFIDQLERESRLERINR
jgi:excisionase family DNA binding protein